MRRTVLHGKIQDGKIVLEESTPLPEGAVVEVWVVPPRPAGPLAPNPELLKFAGIADDLPPNASQSIDQVLYGAPDE